MLDKTKIACRQYKLHFVSVEKTKLVTRRILIHLDRCRGDMFDKHFSEVLHPPITQASLSGLKHDTIGKVEAGGLVCKYGWKKSFFMLTNGH